MRHPANPQKSAILARALRLVAIDAIRAQVAAHPGRPAEFQTRNFRGRAPL
ncbi:hypothetical protein YGS_C1P0365 [Sphingobium sp. YG1]|nr:hypothetical protein YGS_C1P0365 [Sphingobium sp. YG1]